MVTWGVWAAGRRASGQTLKLSLSGVRPGRVRPAMRGLYGPLATRSACQRGHKPSCLLSGKRGGTVIDGGWRRGVRGASYCLYYGQGWRARGSAHVLMVDCRRWQVVCGPEKRSSAIAGGVNGGLAALAPTSPRREGTSKPGARRQSRGSGATPSRGSLQAEGTSGCASHAPFTEGVARAAFGLALNAPLVKARGAAVSDDRGVSDSTLPTRQRGKTTPSLE